MLNLMLDAGSWLLDKASARSHIQLTRYLLSNIINPACNCRILNLETTLAKEDFFLHQGRIIVL